MNISILKLAIAACFPILATIAFYILERNAFWNNKSKIIKQSVIGIVFGLIAVIGTEWGIPINGVMVNCRDAAPVAAGLIFGGPAGIIAGIIGGVERWFAVYWGVGSFTRLACSISTVFSGFFAAFLRKYLFENKRPSWGLALGIGSIMEVFHLYMVFVTNISDATKAIFVVNTCFVPMVIANGLSVTFCVIAVSIMAKEFHFEFFLKRSSTPIFKTIQRWLLIVLTICFIIAVAFIFTMQNNMAKNDTEKLLSSALKESTQDVNDTANTHMLQIANLVTKEVAGGTYNLNELADHYEIAEIVLVNKLGKIYDSNIPQYIGFDMNSGAQSAEFLCLLEGESLYVQDFQATAHDSNVFRKYVGISTNYGFLQIAYDSEILQRQIGDDLISIAKNQLVGTTGGIVIIDNDNNIISHSTSLDTNNSIKENKCVLNIEPDSKIKTISIDGEEYFACCDSVGSYSIVALYSKQDATFSRDVSLYVSSFLMLLIFAIMYTLLYLLIKNIVVKQIIQMANSLSNITNGNLDEVVNVRSNREFSSLSDDINSTVETLKHLIAEAAARIDAELEFAKEIQFSSLPGEWHDNLPEKKFEISATIDTAKEVGGDFYDYYMTDNDCFNFVIADVSGKGIPAAMFMMRAKSVLRSFTERGLAVNDIFTHTNNSLSNENDAGMFVTAWQGVLDINNGLVKYANAGHNPPVIIHTDGTCEYLKSKPNLVLAGMEGLKYRLNEYQLQPGEIIYLYTDGITEATNKDNELYGEDRLLEILSSRKFESLDELNKAVRSDVDAFVKDAPQFDDMTMVTLKYIG